MIRRCNELLGKPIHAVDGECGTLFDFYFNCRTWDIRYAVIALPGAAEPGRVLISPLALNEFDGICVSAHLTKNEIADSPDGAIPVSPCRQKTDRIEAASSEKSNFVNKENQPGITDAFLLASPGMESCFVTIGQERLYSIRAVSGYPVFCEDGKGGEFRDMLIDDQLWIVRFIVFSHALAAGQTEHLLDTTTIGSITWSSEGIHTPCNRDFLRCCLRFDPRRHANVPSEKMPSVFQASGNRTR